MITTPRNLLLWMFDEGNVSNHVHFYLHYIWFFGWFWVFRVVLGFSGGFGFLLLGSCKCMLYK